MPARVRSATLSGIEAATILIEVDVTSGLPSFSTVGFPDSTVRESRDRVRAAQGCELAGPSRRTYTNEGERVAYDFPFGSHPRSPSR